MQDWFYVDDLTSDKVGTASYANNECKIFSNVHYKLYWNKMGFTQNLQKYIVKVEKTT